MRLWSVHPQYLDRQGLTACWREALLAQAVVERSSGGYSNHPQLQRFRATADPLGAVAAYLRGVAVEADARGYRFDAAKILASGPERNHELVGLESPQTHPVFVVVEGDIESWERPKYEHRRQIRSVASPARVTGWMHGSPHHR